MKQLLRDFITPLNYFKSLTYTKQQCTPIQSPSTRFRRASQRLYNQLTEILIEKVPLVSLDIGGTLAKVAVFVPDDFKRFSCVNEKYAPYYSPRLSFKTQQIGGTYLFFKFQTNEIKLVIDFLNDSGFPYSQRKSLRCTGGGAYKYKNLILEGTGYQSFEIHDEMASLRSGLLFMTALKIKNEIYTHAQALKRRADEEQPEGSLEEFSFDLPESAFQLTYKNSPKKHIIPRNWLYPTLYVQVGSGISILKIDAEDYQRIDGSAVGGQTFIILSRLLAGMQSGHGDYNQIMQMLQCGNPAPLTMTVGDIYGRNYNDLPSDIPAAFMSKDDGSTAEDRIAALNQMLCVNIAHIATLNAKLHGLKRIIFSGGFITQYSEKELAFGVDYYSNQQIECIFMQHDLVLGSIGAMFGNEIQYAAEQDNIGRRIEENIQQLETMEASETRRADIEFGALQDQ